MKLRVDWKPRAKRDLGRLDRQTQERIIAAVERFAASGQGNVIHLADTRPREYRLRLAGWRVRFARDEIAGLLIVLHVRRRDQAYR